MLYIFFVYGIYGIYGIYCIYPIILYYMVYTLYVSYTLLLEHDYIAQGPRIQFELKITEFLGFFAL